MRNRTDVLESKIWTVVLELTNLRDQNIESKIFRLAIFQISRVTNLINLITFTLHFVFDGNFEIITNEIV